MFHILHFQRFEIIHPPPCPFRCHPATSLRATSQACRVNLGMPPSEKGHLWWFSLRISTNSLGSCWFLFGLFERCFRSFHYWIGFRKKGKHYILMVKTMFSYRFSLKPIRWFLQQSHWISKSLVIVNTAGLIAASSLLVDVEGSVACPNQYLHIHIYIYT